MSESLAGIMAEFKGHEELLRAAEEAYAAGYRRMDAYSPFPVQGLAKALGREGSVIPMVVLVGGITGGVGGFFMEWFAATVSYPIDVGGRPLNSWVAFIPISFELTILCAALSAVISMLAFNRLPQPHHPVFNVPEFARASSDRFFLCIESTDPRFDRRETGNFLQSLHPTLIAEVAP